MNRITPAVIIALCFVMITCSVEQDNIMVEDTDSKLLFTKALEAGREDDPFFVTLEDIDAYVNTLVMSGKRGKEDVLGILPYGQDEDICSYVVSYTDGWEMISSDKRGPIFLAKSDVGSFEQAISADNVRIWIECLMQDISVRRRLEEEYGRTITEETKLREEESIKFWQVINPNNPLNVFLVPTKVYDGPVITLPDGHWELFSTVYTPVYTDTIGHLCEKKWNQGDPYNLFCPPAVLVTGNCPAGCVAIAGAQMLKYLHNKLGTPVAAPTSLTFWGEGDDYSPNAWNLMETNDTIAAMLIRDVGHKVGMFYFFDGSSASTENLVDYVLQPYGIESTYSNYNSWTALMSLSNEMPVIVSAYRESDFIPNGRAFIIDKCVYDICTVTSTYYWVWDPHTIPLPEFDDSISVSQSIVYTNIGMNWGWATNEDDLLFSPSGTWEVLVTPPDPYHYDYDRKMIHNFRAL